MFLRCRVLRERHYTARLHRIIMIIIRYNMILYNIILRLCRNDDDDDKILSDKPVGVENKISRRIVVAGGLNKNTATSINHHVYILYILYIHHIVMLRGSDIRYIYYYYYEYNTRRKPRALILPPPPPSSSCHLNCK